MLAPVTRASLQAATNARVSARLGRAGVAADHVDRHRRAERRAQERDVAHRVVVRRGGTADAVGGVAHRQHHVVEAAEGGAREVRPEPRRRGDMPDRRRDDRAELVPGRADGVRIRLLSRRRLSSRSAPAAWSPDGSMSSANASKRWPRGRPEVDRRHRPAVLAADVAQRRQVPRDHPHPAGVRRDAGTARPATAGRRRCRPGTDELAGLQVEGVDSGPRASAAPAPAGGPTPRRRRRSRPRCRPRRTAGRRRRPRRRRRRRSRGPARTTASTTLTTRRWSIRAPSRRSTRSPGSGP